MHPYSRTGLKNLFKQFGGRPIKRFGQNFLVDRQVLKKIIAAADIQPSDVVLEIGPGPGGLTQELARRAKKVIAVEKDPKMMDILQQVLKDCRNIEIIQGDIREFNFQFSIFNSETNPNVQFPKHYKVVANLPYYIAAAVIRMFLEAENPPEEMVLLMQKEVAQRLCAKSPKMNLLAVAVQVYADPKIIGYVSKKAFWPQPRVDGAILKISNLKAQISKTFSDKFFKLVKTGFQQPRKQLINNLSRGLKLDKEKTKAWLEKNGINPTQRPQTLTVENWLGLTKSFLCYNENNGRSF